MKKIISLILSIALLATLMPTILVSADTETTTSQRFEITDDTYINGATNSQGNGYGGDVFGDKTSFLWSSGAGSSMQPMLVKTSLADLDIPEGKVVSSVKLNFSVIYWEYNAGKSANVNVWQVSGDWSEDTVNCKSFVGETAALSPRLYNPVDNESSLGNGSYSHPDTTITPADATVPISCASFPAEGQNTEVSVDVTDIYIKQYPNGFDASNPDLSMLLIADNYHYNSFRWTVALTGYETAAFEPYVLVEFGDVEKATVVSESIPNNAKDSLSIAIESNIASATAKVDGVTVDESDITISNNKFTLNYNFANSTQYSVAVDLTDVNGAKFTKTYNFTTNDGTSRTVTSKVYISEDTTLAGRNTGDPGDAGIGNAGEKAYLVTASNPAKDHGYLDNKFLIKASLAGVNMSSDQCVTKAELVMNRIYYGTEGVTDAYYYLRCRNDVANTSVFFYPSTKTWSEDIKINTWRNDSAAMPPLVDSADGNYWGLFVDNGYTKGGANITEFAAVTEDSPLKVSFDITKAFNESLGQTTITDSSVVSFMGMKNVVDTGDGLCFASSEHPNAELRPYIVLTIDDIPELVEVENMLPEMADDAFSVTVSNNISSAEITVNGTKLTDSQYTLNKGTITTNCEFKGVEENIVVVKLTDAYGKIFEKTYTFTPRDINGADSSGVIKKYITEDTMLNAQNVNGGYGMGNYSSDKSMLLRSAGTDTHAALMKLDLSDISIPEGKTISNITLHLSAINDGNTNVNSIDVISHLVTGDFDMSTVTMKDFDGSATLTPDLDFDNPTSTGYPVGDADVTAKLSGLRASTPYSPTSMDITPLFIKKFPDGKLGEDKELAFTIFKQATGYGSNCFIALSEHDDKVARPYVTITLDDTIAESQKASEFYHYSYANQSAAEINDTKYIYKADVKDSETAKINNSVAMMKFALTEDYYDSFVVTYAPNGSGSQKAQRIYKFYNEDNKAGSALTYADFNDEIYEDAMFIGKPDENGTVDVADFANECVANGKDYMCLIISADTSSTTTIKATVPSAVAQKAIAPSISFTGSTPTVAGSYIKSIDAKFTTVLANSAAAKVELYKGATKVEDVTFVSKGNTIDFAAPTKLEENTSYKVILKAGATDLFGNTTTEDIEIAAFTTGVDFVNHGIKLFAKDTEVEKDAFATTDGLSAATVGTEIQGYWRADNNAIEEKALIIAIGAYDDNNELLGVQFSAFDANDEETKIYKTNALTVPTGATKIKAFGWDGTSQAGIAFAEIPVQ